MRTVTYALGIAILGTFALLSAPASKGQADLMPDRERWEMTITELEFASGRGDIDTILSLFATTDFQQSDVIPSMCHAAACGRTDVLQFFADQGYELDYQRDMPQNTLLHYAIIGASPKSVQFLLDANLDTTVKNLRGQTPLEMGRFILTRDLNNADRRNVEECVRLLTGEDL